MTTGTYSMVVILHNPHNSTRPQKPFLLIPLGEEKEKSHMAMGRGWVNRHFQKHFSSWMKLMARSQLLQRHPHHLVVAGS